MPLDGEWELSWDEEGGKRAALSAWDSVLIPGGVIRDVRNTGNTEAHMMAIVLVPPSSKK
jgi:hypothetical protein